MLAIVKLKKTHLFFSQVWSEEKKTQLFFPKKSILLVFLQFSSLFLLSAH